jgi:hypothetical protein
VLLFNTNIQWYIRCHRLKKPCQPSTSIRKRNIKKTSSFKTTQFEEKDDDPVPLRISEADKEQTQRVESSTPDHYTLSDLDNLQISHSSASTSTSPSDVIIDTTTGFARFAQPLSVATASHSSVGSSTSRIADYLSGVEIQDVTAEEQLSTFRHVFLPVFAFVHLPAMMGASELCRQKPFLWLVIMSVTTKSLAQQTVMRNMIRQIVSQEVVVKSEKSLDILLGVLCFTGWLVYNHFPTLNSVPTFSAATVDACKGPNIAKKRKQPSPCGPSWLWH